MNFGFGIATDDVEQVVASRFGRLVDGDGPVAEALFDLLDQNAVEKAALRGDSIDDQTEGAHQEIESQLRASPEAMALINEAPAQSVGVRAKV